MLCLNNIHSAHSYIDMPGYLFETALWACATTPSLPSARVESRALCELAKLLNDKLSCISRDSLSLFVLKI